MKERILQLLHDQDSFAAIEFAITSADALTAVTALDELMRDLYWEQKDLPSAVALGRAAAQHGLASAAKIASTSDELATQLRAKAKGICYNLASFTWRGWDEPGIVVTASEEAIGFDAARANLRLGIELGKGDLPLSRAHWMLGAHQLSRKDYAAALNSFKNAVDFARRAAERGDEALSVAYTHLVEHLASPTDAALDRLLAANRALAEINNGEFSPQFATGCNVFGVANVTVEK